jgi:plastocyanin/quercetin dioxygenase-like cupin family protein
VSADRRSVLEREEEAMRRGPVLSLLLALALVAALGVGRSAGTGAQEATPADGEEPVTLETLGSGTPVAAPDQTLGLYRITLLPGGEIPRHHHPGSLVVHVQSGEVGYTLFEGEAEIVRAPVDGEAGEVEPLVPDEEAILGPGDTVFEENVSHAVRNTGDGEAVILVSGLTTAGEPFLILDEEDGEVEPAGEAATVAVELSEFEIDMPETLPAGPTTFVVTNVGTIVHNFEVEGEGIEVALDAPLSPGESASLTVDLVPGTYEVYCPVANHHDLGMVVELTVTEGEDVAAEDSGEEPADEEPSEEPSGDETDDAEEEDAAGVNDEAAADDGAEDGESDDGTGAASAAVSIVNFSFEPIDLEVAAGTTVTWTNDDSAPHTVTADDGSFDSGTLQPGDTFSFTFEAGAEVTYHCEIHPRMQGRVVVT